MPDEFIAGGVGQSQSHESAHLHVSGEANYIDDIKELKGTLYVATGTSTRAHARIKSLDLSQVNKSEGVVAVIVAKDIPGKNNFGPILDDDPILVESEVQYVGHSIFAVAAKTVNQARRAVLKAEIEYEDLEAVFDLNEAVEKESFVLPTQTLVKGDAEKAILSSEHNISGQIVVGGQDQFYLEGHIAFAVPREDNQMFVYSSSQHPGEVQHHVAAALGVNDNDVVVECRRMGGGFGGKESQPSLFATIAAILAKKTGQAVKFRVDRNADMEMTGKRHDFIIDYKVGFENDGRITGIEFIHKVRAGMSADLTGPVAARAMCHSDNAYFLENAKITSHRCKTNTVSNTAFRGFGGPQGMVGIEYVIDEIARYLKKDPLVIRKINFYGKDERNVTPYQMEVEDNIIQDIFDELEQSSDYVKRREDIGKFNNTSQFFKKGIAITPVKFGISFNATFYNQAGALVNIYHADGTVLLNHGGTEMGQGLFTKVAQVVAEEFQIDISNIRCSASDTSKVPNASATAASSGSDLNGMAAQAAARTIKQRLIDFAAETYEVKPENVLFKKGKVFIGDATLTWAELIHKAYFARICLWSSGFYKIPKIHWDAKTNTGRPFHYFTYGASVSEVLIDTLTGECKLLRADLLHDVGRSINPAIDLGQVEGGFIQGMGWLTSEELVWDKTGRLTTHAPSTYKIPVCSDMPQEFNVNLLKSGCNQEETIYKSKAVGEPPLMLAISVYLAIKDAIASVCDYEFSPLLNAPATPEEILKSINNIKHRGSDESKSKERLAV